MLNAGYGLSASLYVLAFSAASDALYTADAASMANPVGGSVSGRVEVGAQLAFCVTEPGKLQVFSSILSFESDCESYGDTLTTGFWSVSGANFGIGSDSDSSPDWTLQCGGPDVRDWQLTRTYDIPAGDYIFNASFASQTFIGIGAHGETPCEFSSADGEYDSSEKFQVFLRYFPGDVCPGDVNGDQTVGIGDSGAVLSAFGSQAGQVGYNANADVDGDGDIDNTDLAIVLANFGTMCN